MLGQTALRTLDFSFCPLTDAAVLSLVQGLQTLPEGKSAPKLRTLALKQTGMGDAAGAALSEVMGKCKLTKCVVDGNTISQKYVEEIMDRCTRNKNRQQKRTLPKFQHKLG